VGGLDRIDPARIADDNVIWSFHSYDPFLFTHQSAGWTNGPNAHFADLPYPPERVDDALAERLVTAAAARLAASGADLDPAALSEALRDYRAEGRAQTGLDLLRAAAWADRHGIPRNRLILGEFGAMREDMPGRRFQGLGQAEFLADKRRAAEAQGIGWAVWVWTGTFGLAEDDRTRQLPPETCAALGLPGC
jgi:hypothetical protein